MPSADAGGTTPGRAAPVAVRLLHLTEELARSEAARAALERASAELGAENTRLAAVRSARTYARAAVDAVLR